MEDFDKLKMQKDAIDELNDFAAVQRVARRMWQVAADHGFHDADGVELQSASSLSVGRIATFIANLHGECSELWEACRKDAMNSLCDKLGCKLTNAEEELADIIIRAMDTAYSLGIHIGDAIAEKTRYNRNRPHMHGKKC